ncbi:MAG TPA: lysophospholipid acyltransferase family protein [Opitutaceae bacterium]|nr:lysophospholipid acyltransferase family protein [Opitutaceae bacterium]
MNAFYWLSHNVVRVIYDGFFRGDIEGEENLPKRGPFLLAANHQSHLDPPFVGAPVPHEIAFFARKTLWKPGIAARWLNAIDAIPVDRDGGSDVKAMKRVFGAFKSGRVVILFPEGTRSLDGKLQQPKPGIGMLACRAGVPVVPARIFGSFEAFGRGGRLRMGTRVSMVYGKPMMPAEYDDTSLGKARYELAAQRIMARIAAIEEPVFPIV